MSGMEALGRLVDLTQGWTPQDFHADGVTGGWVSLQRASGVLFVVQMKAGTSGDNPTLTLQEAETSSGGSAANLAVIDHYYVKENATPTDDLTGAEVWTEVTQSAAATITQTAADYQLIAIPVLAEQLSAGFSFVNLSVSSSSDAHIGSSVAILHDLLEQRAPTSLAAAG